MIFLIIRCRQFTPSASPADICREGRTCVPNAEAAPRSTVELPVITDQYTTGTRGRLRSSKTESCSVSEFWRSCKQREFSWCCRPNDWASCQFRRGYAAGFNAGYETGFRDGFWAGNNNNVMPITAPGTANESGCGCNCH